MPGNGLFLTGASGLLGRAIRQYFINLGWRVYGAALTRASSTLERLDLTKVEDVRKALVAFQPSFVIHCAAQRYPEKVDSNYEAAKLINVTATLNLAMLCKELGVPMLYISTDYVFDGKSPPYSVDDEPNPINLYGKTKLMGEEATLKYPGNLVLRVSVLYGPVEQLSESAVTFLMEMLVNQTKRHQVSDYEKRRPAHVDDVAKICHLLIQERLKNPEVDGIFHWCGQEVYTKYGMLKTMAKVFKLPCDHVSPNTEIPDSSTARPYDTTLDTSRILSMFNYTTSLSFESLIFNSLLPWVKEYRTELGMSPL